MSPPIASWVRLLSLLTLAGISLLASGCQGLNHWDGPHYRDDPVVSQIDSAEISGRGLASNATGSD